MTALADAPGLARLHLFVVCRRGQEARQQERT